jgi:AAHS family 4-hydroxybenzoate transporter-like MFS transporter
MAALAATYYPTACRATGVSWMLSIGRFGAVTGSFGGAVLTSMGWGFAGVISLLAIPSMIASLSLCALAWHREKKHTAETPVILPTVVPDQSHG